MHVDKEETIKARAYQIWEEEGRPHGRHHEHWQKAMQESADGKPAAEKHPGMMGDGTEEQNLNQPGNPAARISEAEVKTAFATKPTR